MQFDRLAEIAEKHFPQYAPMVQDARLFALHDRGERIKTEPLESWEPDEQVSENFRIPFEVVAIDSGTSCICLKAIDAGKRIYQLIGFNGNKRDQLFCSAKITAFPSGLIEDSGRLGKVVSVEDLEVWKGKGGELEEVNFLKSELAITEKIREGFMGHAVVSASESAVSKPATISVDGGPKLGLKEALRFYGKEKLKMRAEVSVGELEYSMDLYRANIAFLECNFAAMAVLVICEPSTFIVETSEIGLRPRVPQAGKVIRSPYRPHFIVLTPGEIKKRY